MHSSYIFSLVPFSCLVLNFYGLKRRVIVLKRKNDGASSLFVKINSMNILILKGNSEWILDEIKIEKINLVPILVTKSFMEVSALLDVRPCPKLQP